jgi:hypothetical protein
MPPDGNRMSVNTAKVEGRRKVAYQSFDELLADADKLSSGPIKTLGNQSPGQIFKHLAIAYNGSMDGIPIQFPWMMRMMAKVFKKKLLTMQMPAGFNLSPEATKMVWPGPVSTEEGLADLRAAVERLKREPKRVPHPMMGNITKEEWDKVHLTHANLHMSFLVPE